MTCSRTPEGDLGMLAVPGAGRKTVQEHSPIKTGQAKRLMRSEREKLNKRVFSTTQHILSEDTHLGELQYCTIVNKLRVNRENGRTGSKKIDRHLKRVPVYPGSQVLEICPSLLKDFHDLRVFTYSSRSGER